MHCQLEIFRKKLLAIRNVFCFIFQEFDGNKDANGTVSTIGQTMARYIKVIPKFLENQTIACLRMEVYGCKSGKIQFC